MWPAHMGAWTPLYAGASSEGVELNGKVLFRTSGSRITTEYNHVIVPDPMGSRGGVLEP